MDKLASAASGGKPMRILIAPHDVAGGQMHLLAEALRRKGYDATSVNYYADSRKSDINLGFTSGRRTPRRVAKLVEFTARAIPKYDVFHFFFGESLLPGYWDLPILKRLDKKVIVHFRGSDIRQRKYLTRAVEGQLQGLSSETGELPSSPSQIRRIQTWRKYADGIFVSIPELLQIVPDATLVQQAIELSKWEYSPEPVGETPGDIIIAHPTSDRSIKGTKFVVEAVNQLKERGYPVRLTIIENTPHEQVKELYKSCHIGVDELLQGSYGNVSIELMAMGKPVVAYLDSWYSSSRPDLPIVNATPLGLAEKLRILIEDQKLRRELGKRGRAYVERWHDANVIADQLISLYQKRGPTNGSGMKEAVPNGVS